MIKIGILAIIILLVTAFYAYFRFYVASVRASHTPTVFVDDTNDRILPGGSGSTIRINVSNNAGSVNNIQQVFFALPNGTSVSSIVAPPSWTCGCGANGGNGTCSLSGGSGNGFNCSSTSNKITAATWVLFNFSMTPSTITSVGNWNWTTTDDAGTPASSTGNSYTTILSPGDIGIDLRDTGNNVLTGGLIRLILVNSTGGQVDNSSMKYENISSSGLYVWSASQINSLVGGLAPTSYSYVISQSTNPVRVPSAQESYSPTLTNVPSGTPIQLNTSLAQLSVSVFDQLSNNRTNANVSIYIVNGTACTPTSLLGINQTSPETNIVNFTLQAPNADSGMIYYVQATKAGYVDSYCTVVNLTSSFKVNLAFNGTRNNLTTPYNNTFALQQGLNYSVVVLAQNELNGTITFNSTNTSFRGYSTLQTPGASSGVIFPTFNTSGITAGNVFLNVTGSGILEINVSGYVRRNTTSALTPVSTSATQVEYYNSSVTEGDSLLYTFRINTLQSETGAALTQTAADNVTLANNNNAYTALNISLFSSNWYIAVPNDTAGYRILYNKTGFISTNTSAVVAGMDSQTFINYVNTTGQGQGLPYSLKIRVDDEVSQDIDGGNETRSNIFYYLNYTQGNGDLLNISFSPNVTQFGAAFFAIPQNASAIGLFNQTGGNSFLVRVNKTGYVMENSSAMPINTTTQAFADMTLLFATKINTFQDELGNALTQGAVTQDTITFYNTSDNSTFSWTYTPINSTFSGNVWYFALDPHFSYNLSYQKPGYLLKNASVQSIRLDAQTNIAFSRFTNGLNHTVKLVAYDALNEGIGVGDLNTTFYGFSNSTQVKYSSNDPTSFDNHTNVTAYISFIPNVTNGIVTINVSGFTSVASAAINLSNSTQAILNYSLNSGGSNGTALNYTFIIDRVQDELGNTLTPNSGDQIRVYFPGTNIVHTPVKAGRLAAGNVWYLAVATNTSWIINYSRAGYIDRADTKSSTYLRPTLVNYTQYTNGLNFTLRIDVYDELNSSAGMRDNMTFNIAFTSSPAPSDYVAISPNSTSTNSYYFGLNPANNTYALRIAKVGYVTKNGTFESALNSVGLGNITQTFLNLTGVRVCSTSAGNATVQCGGMLFGIRATAGDELGSNLTLDSTNTTFIADPLAGTNALTLNNSLTAFSRGVAYLAANSSGTGSKLEINVTGFVRVNTTNNILSTAYTYQQNASYQNGGSGSALLYFVKIGVQRAGVSPAVAIPDASVNVSNNQNTLFLYSSANDSANAFYYFPINFTNYTRVNVSVFRTGYISTGAPTNNPLNLTLSDTAQQYSNVTLTASSTGSIDGFVYLTNSTIRINSTATVTALGSGITTSTDSSGYYKLTDVAVGTYTVSVTGSGYRGNQTTGVSVTAGGTTRSNQFVMGAENFNISIPGTVTSGNTNGFWDVGWHDFFLSTRAYGPTTNTTIALLFNSVGSNYTIVYRYNATSATWSSYVPGAAGNTLTNIADSDDHYWTYINGTSRVELENRYT